MGDIIIAGGVVAFTDPPGAQIPIIKAGPVRWAVPWRKGPDDVILDDVRGAVFPRQSGIQVTRKAKVTGVAAENSSAGGAGDGPVLATCARKSIPDLVG